MLLDLIPFVSLITLNLKKHPVQFKRILSINPSRSTFQALMAGKVEEEIFGETQSKFDLGRHGSLSLLGVSSKRSL